MFFKQVRAHGDNFSYVVADNLGSSDSWEAAIVDCSYNSAEIIDLLRRENFVLKYIFCTHGHPDHIAGNNVLKSTLGGQIVAHSLFRGNIDIKVEDGGVLTLGDLPIKVLYTPGHTVDGICLLVAGQKLLTGDTLFVGECGRVDLPGGSAERLYDTLFNKLMHLDDAVEIYPGHDYGNKPYSTMAEQKRVNYVLKPRSLPEFIKFMSEP